MFASTKRSALLSWLLHCGAILLILAVTGVKPKNIPLLREILVTPADITEYRTSVKTGGGGGGGGVHADSPATRGKLPEFAREMFVKPTVTIENPNPILPMAPTLIGDSEIKQVSFDYQKYGVLNGPLGKPSGGPGSGGGIGDGDGPGIGSGKGPGAGPGEGGNQGGGPAAGYLGFGGSVTPPVLEYKTEPEYSEDARKARLQGTVMLCIEVDTQGQAQHIKVSQSLGLGLDDRAIDAVKKWKFKPGKVNGKPTTVLAYVEVNFRLL